MHLSQKEVMILLWSATMLFAYGVVWLFKWSDRRRTLAGLVVRPCPNCSRVYGAKILGTIAEVRYRWVLLQGYTAAKLGAPRSTFLVTCPQCDSKHEYRESGRLFVHPQGGVISFTRTVRNGRAVSRRPLTPADQQAGKPC
jgi:hypothetical protein